MKKEQAEEEKLKHINLQDKVLLHKKYNEKMQVVEIGIEETTPKSNNFYVYCKLRGKLGNITETLKYVLENYEVSSGCH